MRADGQVPVEVGHDLEARLVVLQFSHGYLATSPEGARQLADALYAAAQVVEAAEWFDEQAEADQH